MSLAEDEARLKAERQSVEERPAVEARRPAGPAATQTF